VDAVFVPLVGYLGSIGVMMPSLSSIAAAASRHRFLAVLRADHLYRLGQAISDADRKRHRGQSQGG